jgi:hypothetical protein
MDPTDFYPTEISWQKDSFVKFSQRKPIEIARIIYLTLPFDSEGRIGLAEKQREKGPAKKAENPLFTKEELAGPIIDGWHHSCFTPLGNRPIC